MDGFVKGQIVCSGAAGCRPGAELTDEGIETGS